MHYLVYIRYLWLYRTCRNNLATSLIISTSLLQVVNKLFHICWQLGTSSANTTCWRLVGRLATRCVCNNNAYTRKWQRINLTWYVWWTLDFPWAKAEGIQILIKGRVLTGTRRGPKSSKLAESSWLPSSGSWNIKLLNIFLNFLINKQKKWIPARRFTLRLWLNQSLSTHVKTHKL
jgi:hypothetical protein